MISRLLFRSLPKGGLERRPGRAAACYMISMLLFSYSAWRLRSAARRAAAHYMISMLLFSSLCMSA